MIIKPTALSGEVTGVADSSECFLDFYQSTVCHMPEVRNFGSHRHEKFNSQTE